MIEEQKQIIVKNIKHLLKQNKMTQSELADRIGIAKSTLSDYMNYRSKPGSGVLEKMAIVFGVTKSDIDTTYKNTRAEIINGKLELVNDFTNEKGSKFQYTNSRAKIPVLGKISAGKPIEAIEEIVDEIYPAYEVNKNDEIFGLVVHGESMNKIAPNGNYAVLRKQQDVENGEIAAVIVNGDYATLKKVYKFTDLIILEPCSHDEMFIDQKYTKENCNEIRIIGKYLYSVSPMIKY